MTDDKTTPAPTLEEMCVHCFHYHGDKVCEPPCGCQYKPNPDYRPTFAPTREITGEALPTLEEDIATLQRIVDEQPFHMKISLVYVPPLKNLLNAYRRAIEERDAAQLRITNNLCEIDNLRATIGASPYDLPADVVVLAISRLKAGCKAG